MKWARRYRARLRAAFRAALGAWRNEFVTIEYTNDKGRWVYMNCLLVSRD